MPKKKKSMFQLAMEHHKNIPLCPEYKTLFFQSLKLTYKWIPHVNHAIDYVVQVEKQAAATPAAMKKIRDMRSFLNSVCELRNGLLIINSFIIFIGMNNPTKSAANKISQIMDKMDDSILTHLAIIQRFGHTILEHKKLSLKGLNEPLTLDDIKQSDLWPNEAILTAAFINGQKVCNVTVGGKP